MIWRSVIRLLWHSKKFSILFVLNFFIGIFALIVVTSFSDSFLQALHKKSKELLGADISVSTRREFEPTDLKVIETSLPPGTLNSQMIEMYTMARSEKSSKLTLLTVIDQQYPFYGSLSLQSGRQIVNGSQREIDNEKKVWVYPEVLIQLGVKLGDKLSIGVEEFEISDVVVSASGQTAGWTALAPVIYMSSKFLSSTQLVEKGSTAWRSRLYKLPEMANADEIVAQIEKHLVDPGIQVATHTTSSERTSRVMMYLTDYLGLVSILALVLSSLGVFFLCQSYLWRERKNIAILKVVGAPPQIIFWTYQGFFIVLAVIGFVLAAVTASFLFSKFGEEIIKLTSFAVTEPTVDVSIQLSYSTLFYSLIGGIAVIFLVNLPTVVAQTRIKVAGQLSELGQSLGEGVLRIYISVGVLVFAAIWAMSVWVSNSFYTSSLFLAALTVVVIGLLIVHRLVTVLLRSVYRRFALVPRHALIYIFRKSVFSGAIFLVFALTSTLLNFIFSVEKSLLKELAMGSKQNAPSLFLFDIQDEQVQALKDILTQQEVVMQSLAPMVQAKLTKVNGKNFVREMEGRTYTTRESEREKRTRNRTMNLSYRGQLSSSEQVSDGDFSSGGISLEREFASRLGLKLGDQLTFDILGVEVSDVVKSLRRVRWTSFQPNFFILLPESLLADAPKVWIATLPQLKEEKKNELQIEVTKSLPNVSMVDVSRLTENILKMISSVAMALRGMALILVVACFFIVVSFSQVITQQKIKDLKLFKVLGLPLNKVFAILILENYLVLFLATFIGFIMSMGLTLVGTQFVFTSEYDLALGPALTLLFAIPLAGTTLVLLFSQFELFSRSVDDVRSFR